MKLFFYSLKCNIFALQTLVYSLKNINTMNLNNIIFGPFYVNKNLKYEVKNVVQNRYQTNERKIEKNNNN